MRKYLCCGLLVLIVAPVRAEAPPKVVKETWDAVYIEGARSGFVRTTVHELERDGKKVYRTTQEMNLLIKRYDAVVRTRIESTVDETAEGKIVGYSLTLFPDKGGKFATTGTVKDGKLLVKADGDANAKSVAWDDKAIGPYKQDRLLAERKVKPDDKVEFLSFEPSANTPVMVHVVVKAAEDKDVLEVKKDGDTIKVERVKKNLLRVEAKPDKIMLEGRAVQLPTLVSWMDKEYTIARSEYDFPGFGKMTLYRTTPEAAKQEGLTPALLPDLGLNTLIPVAQAIENMEAKSMADYRITIKDDDDPASAFTKDARQEVMKDKDGSCRLIVRAVRAPVKIDNPGKVDEEYLKSTFFIDSADAKVKELTVKAVGDEKDDWKKAQLIESWVHKHMNGASDINFATASQVAKDLRGDCRQYAMLTTALCRAAGVPSRTAVGLIYVRPEKGEPFLGFHMWTEVWIKGQWLGLDATLGQGSIGPGHLKIADHSWNTHTLAPVLPVLRVMGKAKVEVLSVK